MRLVVAVFEPIPQLANWQPLLQPLAALAGAVGLGFAPHRMLAIIVLFGVLLVIAAFKLQFTKDRYETPDLCVQYIDSDAWCNQDQLGSNADGQNVRVWLLKRLRVKNLSKHRIEHVRLVLEACEPSMEQGILHKQLDMMHDTNHEYQTTGFPLAPDGTEYVDVIMQHRPDDAGQFQFQFADGHGSMFAPGLYSIVISVHANTVPEFQRSFNVGVDGQRRLIFR